MDMLVDSREMTELNKLGVEREETVTAVWTRAERDTACGVMMVVIAVVEWHERQ